MSAYAAARKKAAQKRAADKLIAAHPDEYKTLLEQEMDAEGYERREVVVDEWVPKKAIASHPATKLMAVQDVA